MPSVGEAPKSGGVLLNSTFEGGGDGGVGEGGAAGVGDFGFAVAAGFVGFAGWGFGCGFGWGFGDGFDAFAAGFLGAGFGAGFFAAGFGFAGAAFFAAGFGDGRPLALEPRERIVDLDRRVLLPARVWLASWFHSL